MGKPIKVLLFSLSENIGGIETLLRNLNKQFDHSEFEFDFVTTYASPVYKEEFLSSGSRIFKLPSQKRVISYYFALKKIIKQNHYDVIHVNKNSCADITPFLVGHRLHVPVIIAHAHNTKSSVGRAADILHYFNRPRVDRLMTHAFASSQAAAEWMFGKKYCKTHAVPILKNGIQLESLRFDETKREEIRQRLSLGGKFVLGHVGRFSPRKNHDFLLEIFKTIHEKNPKSVLMLIGTGPLMAQIQRKIHVLGLSDAVMFMGAQKNINEYYAAMDAFILPSLADDLPVAAIEAQASGLPVFVSDTIDGEVEITDTVKWLSLQQPAEIWADMVLNTCDCFERKDQSEALRCAGYDIGQTAGRIAEVYKTAEEQ